MSPLQCFCCFFASPLDTQWKELWADWMLTGQKHEKEKEQSQSSGGCSEGKKTHRRSQTVATIKAERTTLRCSAMAQCGRNIISDIGHNHFYFECHYITAQSFSVSRLTCAVILRRSALCLVRQLTLAFAHQIKCLCFITQSRPSSQKASSATQKWLGKETYKQHVNTRITASKSERLIIPQNLHPE